MGCPGKIPINGLTTFLLVSKIPPNNWKDLQSVTRSLIKKEDSAESGYQAGRRDINSTKGV